MSIVQIPLTVKKINDFINRHPPGTTFRFMPGTYRLDDSITPRSKDEFVGTIRGHKRVSTITGALPIAHWIFNGKMWMADVPAPHPHNNDGGCRTGYPMCNFPNDLFVDDELQKLVSSRTEVIPGTWHFDEISNQAFMGTNPKGRLVELSFTPAVFKIVGGVSDVLLEDLIVEKYAMPSGGGAVNLGDAGVGALRWRCQSCEVKYCHGAGIYTNAESAARYNYIHHNGGFGFCGAGWNILVEGNEICYNNTCGYDPYWGAGGSKWVWTTDLIVRGNYSHHNLGVGLWTDINNLRSTYEDNVVEDNWLAGIFHEISYDAIIRRNTCRRNGLEKRWPYWTANAGIAVCGSRNVEVYENIVEDNWQEITGLDDGRNDPNAPHGAWELTNFKVYRNIVKTSKLWEPGTGRTGVVGPHPFFFDYNKYEIIEGLQEPFFDTTNNLTFEQWQAMGQDVNGTFTRI